jgi:hypothetical protein
VYLNKAKASEILSSINNHQTIKINNTKGNNATINSKLNKTYGKNEQVKIEQNYLSKDDNSDNFNNDPERKDSIPLLIIDVNIRPGVKKKIYVFDGDTADGLAERFAKEHSK